MADYKKIGYKVARLLASLVAIGLLHKIENKNGSSKGLTALSSYVGAWGAGGLAGMTALLASYVVGAAVGVALLAGIAIGWLVVLIARRKAADRFDISVEEPGDHDDDEDDDLRDDAVSHGPDGLASDDEDDVLDVEIEEVETERDEGDTAPAA